MSHSRHHPRRVEPFVAGEDSPIGTHERRAYRVHHPNGSLEEGAWERRIGPSGLLFDPSGGAGQVGQGRGPVTMAVDAIDTVIFWLIRVVFALLQQAGYLGLLLLGWELSRLAGGSGWPGLGVALVIVAIVSEAVRGEGR